MKFATPWFEFTFKVTILLSSLSWLLNYKLFGKVLGTLLDKRYRDGK